MAGEPGAELADAEFEPLAGEPDGQEVADGYGDEAADDGGRGWRRVELLGSTDHPPDLPGGRWAHGAQQNKGTASRVSTRARRVPSTLEITVVS